MVSDVITVNEVPIGGSVIAGVDHKSAPLGRRLFDHDLAKAIDIFDRNREDAIRVDRQITRVDHA